MTKSSLGWWIALVLLLAASFAWRCRAVVELDGKPWIQDADTVHRIARIEALDRAPRAPLVDPREGAPLGVESHWTLPMDLVVRALTPLGALVWPRARGYEAGALLAGPVLGTLAVALVVLFVWRRMAPGYGILAGVVYAFQGAVVASSWLGNGDHQTLQALAIVGGLGAFTRALSGAGGTRTPLLAGLWLGGAIWVSAESMLVVYLVALVAFGLAWRERGAGAELRRALQACCTGMLLVVVAATFLEQRADPLRLVWDTVSLFHVWQVLVLTAFSVFLAWPLRGWRRATIAAGLGVAIGLLPMLLPALRAAVATSLEQVAGTDLWGRHEVGEYRAAFWDGSGYSFAAFWERFGPWPFALPVAAIVVWRHAPWRRAMRFGLILFAFGTLLLATWEAKLAPLHAAPGAWLLATAVFVSLHERRTALGVVGGLTALGALAVLVGQDAPGRERDPRVRAAAEERRLVLHELVTTVARLAAADPGATVLAPWQLGAHLHALTPASVVASGYHRNLAGILDAHRFYLAPLDAPARWKPILASRAVRYVVAWPDGAFLLTAPKVVGDATEYARATSSGVEVLPAGEASLAWQLRRGKVGPEHGFTLVAESTHTVDVGAGDERAFRVYRSSP